MNSKKIEEAQDILMQLDLPAPQQNERSALVFLALCNIRPKDNWNQARRESMVVATDIMNFIRDHYQKDYAYGSRETIRKATLHQFIEGGLIDKNPDNPTLPTNSPHTHYAITPLALNIIQKYKTHEWEEALESFKVSRISLQSTLSGLVTRGTIINFKSIAEQSIDFGRFNVFIGTNGCGKTNILEAVATLIAERSNDLNFEGLNNRGVRLSRPNLVLSSFKRDTQANTANITIHVENEQEREEYKCEIGPQNINDTYTRWVNLADEANIPDMILEVLQEIANKNPGISGNDLMNLANEVLVNKPLKVKKKFDDFLSGYAIFDINTRTLRGIASPDSKRTPLGLNGEGLDLLIATFNEEEKKQLATCNTFFEWLENVFADKDDKLKYSGLRAGSSISTLYFQDKYMNVHNNTLSAENSNEGVLHVLFYLALFISRKTPRFFAIDNIEKALNPRLCQVLITELVKLSKQNKKQVLITTHNPAILDGLNLLDDEQRLFEVYRDTQGHTRVRRKKFKDDLSDKKFKLSELWLKGLLGAVPENF